MSEWVTVNGHRLYECAYLRSLERPWEPEERCDCGAEDNDEPEEDDLYDDLAYEGDETDLSSCPYFQTMTKPDAERGTCSFGCWDEPRCITCEPENGWPGMRAVPDAAVS